MKARCTDFVSFGEPEVTTFTAARTFVLIPTYLSGVKGEQVSVPVSYS